jgi:hypothetical protein
LCHFNHLSFISTGLIILDDPDLGCDAGLLPR